MTRTAPQITREEAIERGHKARADAAREAGRAIREFLAARLTKEATA